jgi:hypothetical protein
MNRCKSVQTNINSMDYTISKSPSLDSFLNIAKNVTIHFEGDGQLGILFNKNTEGKMIVAGIKKFTVADEYYDLKIDMIVDRVNEYKFDDFLYENYMKLIGLLWNTNHELKIEFIMPDLNENDIYRFLKSINCEKHIDIFKNLGAKTKIDLSYVENDDLVNIDIKDREKIMNSIKRIESEVFDFDD